MSVGIGEIPVTVFRERIRQLGLSHSEVARRLGWMRESPDTQRVRRTLGLTKAGGKGLYQQEVSIEMAERLVQALGMDPVDAGL